MITLEGLEMRVATLLADHGGVVWSSAAITEAARLALGEYNLASGAAAVTVSDLDGAETTTLPAAHESLLVLGAAGYAALARAVDFHSAAWVEGFSPPDDAPDRLQGWAENRLAEFRWMLRNLFPAYGGGGPVEPARLADLHNASEAPWSTWGG